MAKRIVLGILGAIAAFGSFLPLGYAFEIFKDFNNPDTSFWPNVLGVVLMCSIALPGFWLGMRFLGFALSGRSEQSNGIAKPILLGIGSFFPGCVFSLPITILWVSRKWPGDDAKIDLAFKISASLGVAVAIICTILLRRKRGKAASPSTDPQFPLDCITMSAPSPE
jgi:hypothetical protein